MNICNQPINNTNNQPIICNHWHSDGLMANLWDSTRPKLSDFSSEIIDGLLMGSFMGNVQQNGAAIHSKRATKEVFHQQISD